MPHTINGIGTHYYGKSDVSQRQGECRSCKRTTTLSSYDTRLFFVVVFIPLIPLGRKRIMDQCPACRRHYVMPLKEWETQRKQQVSTAMEEYRLQPTAAHGMAAHGTLMSFRLLREAEELRTTLLREFPDNIPLLLHLEAWDRREGKTARADETVRKAFALDPEPSSIRFAMAAVHRRAGQLDEARALLSPLEKEGSGALYSLGELEHLANAYLRAARFREAHQLMSSMLREVPAVGQDSGFRKRFQQAEKGAAASSESSGMPGSAVSLLPKRDFSPGAIMRDKKRRNILLGSVALVVIAACLAGRNEYLRGHRTLTLVNGYDSPMMVAVPGAARRLIPAGGRGTVTVPEGPGTARVTGAVEQEISFRVETPYFDRWTKSPVFVLNPGGAFPLIFQRQTYGEDSPPPEERFVLGESFSTFEDVDRYFDALPESVSVTRGSTTTLSSLERWKFSTSEIVERIGKQQGAAAALTAAESALAPRPDDEETLDVYTALAVNDESLLRIQKTLRAGLEDRPVKVFRHRAWQDVNKDPAEAGEIQAYYHEKAAAEPGNASLLYLEARTLGDSGEAIALYEKARALDSDNFWPPCALGYLRMQQGRWTEAKELLGAALKIFPASRRAGSALFQVRLALGETTALASELNGTSSRQVEQLFDQRSVYAVAGKAQELHAVSSKLVVALQAASYAPEVVRITNYAGLYMEGNTPGLTQSLAGDQSAAGLRAREWLELEAGRLDEAEKTASALTRLQVARQPAEFALAAFVAGDQIRALSAVDALTKSLESGDSGSLRQAALLKQTEAVTQDQLDELFMEPQQKALLCAVLAGLHPAQKPFLLDQASRFNFRREFPHRMIARAVAAGSGQ